MPQVATLFGFVPHVQYVSSLSVNEFTSCFDALIQLVEDRTWLDFAFARFSQTPKPYMCCVFSVKHHLRVGKGVDKNRGLREVVNTLNVFMLNDSQLRVALCFAKLEDVYRGRRATASVLLSTRTCVARIAKLFYRLAIADCLSDN